MVSALATRSTCTAETLCPGQEHHKVVTLIDLMKPRPQDNQPRKPRGSSGRADSSGGTFDDAKGTDNVHDELQTCKLIDGLEFRHGVDPSTLDLQIRHGRGSIRGLVTDQEEIDAIRDSLMEEGGITDLEVSLRIAPTMREEDRDLARSLQMDLENVRGLAEADIRVACVQSAAGQRTVVLRGSVTRMVQKQLAGLVVLRRHDELRLRNRLLVVGR